MKVCTSLATIALSVMAGLLLSFGVRISTNSVMAADVTIHGVVTDNGGKPIRGAIVKATLGSNSVARFTDADGRYQISELQNGSYDVSATAWGFGP
jgi:protocatechuate 3,4-dioxygenase beta subunit